MDENQINKLKEVRNLVSYEFKNFYKPSETVPNYIDLILEVNERDTSFNKRKENKCTIEV